MLPATCRLPSFGIPEAILHGGVHLWMARHVNVKERSSVQTEPGNMHKYGQGVFAPGARARVRRRAPVRARARRQRGQYIAFS